MTDVVWHIGTSTSEKLTADFCDKKVIPVG
jgi:hypothetical protein